MRSRRRMNHLQPEHLLKAIKIVVPVQQFVFGLQTKTGNETIDRLVNGVAALAQLSIILSGDNGQAATACLKNLELQQVGSHPRERALLPNTL